jgi:hypothetical protein
MHVFAGAATAHAPNGKKARRVLSTRTFFSPARLTTPVMHGEDRIDQVAPQRP